MRWYVLDAREVGSPPISTCQWIMRFIFLMLQLGPILRYFDSLIYGLKFMQNKTNKQEQVKYFQYMIYEDTDATMLRLFECFMEAAPQLVLQLYILARSTPHGEEDHWTGNLYFQINKVNIFFHFSCCSGCCCYSLSSITFLVISIISKISQDVLN